MKIATRTFTFTDAYGSGEVTKGERIADDHELVKMFPDAWRNFTLDDELKIRSTRVAELREAAERPAGRAPVSRAGREERKQEDFWRSVDRMLHPDDGRTSEERREQAVFDANAPRYVSIATVFSARSPEKYLLAEFHVKVS